MEQKTNIPSSERIFAGLCYILVFGFIGLMTSKDKFVRFHAWQSVLLWLASVVIIGILEVLNLFALMNIFTLILLGGICFLFYKAYSGEVFKLPLLGPFAAKRAGVL